MNEQMDWKFTNQPKLDVSAAVTSTVTKMATEHLPDLADLFPFDKSSASEVYFDEAWFAVSVTDKRATAIPTMGDMSPENLALLRDKIEPFTPRSYEELKALLGPDWYSSTHFTYVGRHNGGGAAWHPFAEHIRDWVNDLVLPSVYRLNSMRVLRAIPTPPTYDVERIRAACWVLESESASIQGTAFILSRVGLVTCQHVLRDDTVAFRPDAPSMRYPVTVEAANRDLDLAILNVPAGADGGLSVGSSDGLNEMDHLAIAGFPNYRLGDTGTFTPGLVVGFRPVSGIRRILTNAPIVAGTSGGPVVDANGAVVGVAVTGADRMESAQETEHHGVVPIDALQFLK